MHRDHFYRTAIAIVATVSVATAARCRTASADQDRVLNYHNAPSWTIPLMKNQHRFELPSVLVADDGTRIDSPHEWLTVRRPELIRHWTRILGKLGPTAADKQWFGKATQAAEVARRQEHGYTRIELKIRMEKDFEQPHLLLLPRGQGAGPFPVVIAWTSTSPDYTQPESWWGSWLARRGFVVLTGWSHIRNYRGGVSYRTQVNEAVYQRFGHWLPMAKMVKQQPEHGVIAGQQVIAGDTAIVQLHHVQTAVSQCNGNQIFRIDVGDEQSRCCAGATRIFEDDLCFRLIQSELCLALLE